ncbi:ATP-binding protein, partial [Enterobacter cloacae]
MKFEKAMRKKAKLRLALTGPSGSGKTYSALLVAKGIGGKIAFIDTEKGSASLYSDVAEFDVLELDPPFSPERFIEAIKSAEDAGYDSLVIDSITHEWGGVGGCLELVDTIAKAKYRGNSWSAWSEINPRHRLFLDAILRSPMHIIATMRSKTETAQVEENGRKKVAKLGMKSEQRDGVEYEFTTVLDIAHETHHAIASK